VFWIEEGDTEYNKSGLKDSKKVEVVKYSGLNEFVADLGQISELCKFSHKRLAIVDALAHFSDKVLNNSQAARVFKEIEGYGVKYEVAVLLA
jgi:hypothetical protein